MARRTALAWWLLAAVFAGRAAAAEAPARDLAALVEAAAPGAAISLEEGRYAADLVLRKRVSLVGKGVGRTVLAGTVTFAEGGSAEALSIEAGGAGAALVVRRDVLVRDVAVRGAEPMVVRVVEGATLTATDLAVACRERAAAGLSVAGTATLSNVSVDGPCRRGIDLVSKGSAAIVKLRVTGAQDAGIRVVEGSLAVSDGVVQMEAGAGSAALFAARSIVRAERLRISGGDQGVLVRKGEARFVDVSVDGTTAAGMAFVQASAAIRGGTLTGPFSHAAVLVSELPAVTLDDVEVVHAGAAAVLVVHGSVTVRGMKASGLVSDEEGDFGHAFVFERSTAEVSHARVTDAAGGLAWVSGPSHVTLDDVAGERVRLGVAALSGGELKATRLSVTPAPAVGAVAWGKSRIVLDRGFGPTAALAACTGSTVALPAAEQGRVRTCSDDDLSMKGWTGIQ